MRARQTTRVLICLLTTFVVAQAGEPVPPEANSSAPAQEPEPRPEPKRDAKEEKPETRLLMAPAVACRSIGGYEDYEVLPDATLTADEKLLIYYRPINYRIEKVGKSNHVHLTQDGQIRRHGNNAVLQRKEKLLDYEFKGEGPAWEVFLKNTISLKGLKPGVYDFDIILHDELAKAEIAKQCLLFKVVAASLPKAEKESDTDAAKAEKESDQDAAKEPPPSSQKHATPRKDSRASGSRSSRP